MQRINYCYNVLLVTQVRVIPVQLQILFSRLLLLNQQSCGVDGLVSSFGWTNNEVYMSVHV